MDVPAYISAAGLLIAGLAAAGALVVRRDDHDDDHDDLVRFLEQRLSECEEREKRRTRRRTADG